MHATEAAARAARPSSVRRWGLLEPLGDRRGEPSACGVDGSKREAGTTQENEGQLPSACMPMPPVFGIHCEKKKNIGRFICRFAVPR